MPDTIIFVPAWNEEDNLGAVLTELREELPTVDLLVVDDGSTDATAVVAREHGSDVVSFGENRGLRAAIATGYGEAAARGYAFCGRVDADGQHPAAELRRLLELVRNGECDVAVGSRFVSGEGYPAYRYTPRRPVGSARGCSGARCAFAWAAASATRRAGCTRPTRWRCRSSPSRTPAAHPR